MKPIKNKIYCNGCKGIRMLFEAKKKAENFIRFNSDEILKETGKAPIRCYYCKSCGGWHVTSNPDAEYFTKKDFLANFDLEQCRKKIYNCMHNLCYAYTTREYKEYYELIEQAYTEIENLVKAGIDSSEFENVINKLNEYAAKLHQICPNGNPKLNSSIKRLDELMNKLKIYDHSFVDNIFSYREVIEEMDIEIKNAIRFGASKRRLKKYYNAYELYSSPSKIKLRLERKELYNQIVSNYKKRDYKECAELIRLSYLNFHTSLNEGVSEREIQSAINRIKLYKEFVENLKTEN